METGKVLQGLLISLAAVMIGWFLLQHAPKPTAPDQVQPIIIPVPTPVPVPRLPVLPRIRRGDEKEPVGKITLGGNVGPDGKTEVTCDLPVSERVKNVGGKDGAGLCVFSSITHSARYQSEPRLLNFQEVMRKENGGGYPDKVTAMIKKYGPGCQFVQFEGGSTEILKLALRTGRYPCVTYSGSDGVHYRGTVAHMVNLCYFNETTDLACICDNNFVGENELVWMSCADFVKRWKGSGQGWAVILLSPPPAPAPRN